MNNNDLQAAILGELNQQGLTDVGESLSAVLVEYCLTWKVSASDLSEVDGIVAFAFGNRVDKLGNRSPGPVNELLAQALYKYYSLYHCKVWAQWEIAELISNRIPHADLVPVYPNHDRTKDQLQYLSTKGVLEQIKKNLPEGKRILVIAHRDHLWRCIRFTEKAGYQAVSSQSDMPDEYDPQSGQIWTTSREKYVLSDIISRLITLRDERNTEALAKKG
jgi:hypothetical protein